MLLINLQVMKHMPQLIQGTTYEKIKMDATLIYIQWETISKASCFRDSRQQEQRFLNYEHRWHTSV